VPSSGIALGAPVGSTLDVTTKMAANWVTVFNRLFEIINQKGTPSYFSGPRFIDKVREIDQYFPQYRQYIDERHRTGKSTSRKGYFYDILLGFDEDVRMRLLQSILSDVESDNPEMVAELRGLLGGKAYAPRAIVPADAWSAERLNDYLNQIDASIGSGNYERAISLSYSTLEGAYKAFVRKNVPEKTGLNEILGLSKEIKRYLSGTLTAYPDEVLSMVNHISHTVDRARNKFSESHFESEAARWLAVYIRDLVNTQVRLLLHFL
jgi:hypothetical protein